MTDFITKAKAIHGDKYDYSLVEYVDSHTKIILKCKEHNLVFSILPYAHINQKQGCKLCGYKNRKSNRKSTETFIIEAKTKWNYNYSITEYINKTTKIKYVCESHGEIEQMPTLHIKHGCPYCNGRGISKHTIESFVKKANEVHNGFYIYDKISFNSVADKITITCPIHGDFNQKAANHINLINGCPKCNGGVAIDTIEYLTRAKEAHGDKFDYTQTQYVKAHEKIKIICPKHGEFEQMAYVHLQSEHCCPKCVAELTSSLAEKEIISFLKEHYSGPIEPNDRVILGYKEIDIFLPDKKLGIEFHGNYFHRREIVGKGYHFNKYNLAKKNGIHLIQIFEHQWGFRLWEKQKEIVKSRLLSVLGVNEKIGGRETKIVELRKEVANDFLNKTHLQGNGGDICIGLEHEGVLVSCMTFGKPRFNKNYDYELIRYASKENVIGGASKLLSYFRDKCKGSIITYADNCWSSGNLYEKLGFRYDGETGPGYFYYHIGTKKIVNRMAFQKHKLINMPFYDDNLSEYEILKLNGYDQIWDAGNSRWVL